MRTQPTVAGFEDEGRGLKTEECRQPLELKKEMNSPLGPPERNTLPTPVRTIVKTCTLHKWKVGNLCYVSEFVVIYCVSNRKVMTFRILYNPYENRGEEVVLFLFPDKLYYFSSSHVC